MSRFEEIVQPEEFTITNIFKATEYVVPIYQRNYAWEKDEIEQLLVDINDSTGKYYLGSLIVNQLTENKFEVIDGQQRLTTLYLLLSFLKDSSVGKDSLRFEAREKSNKTLQDIGGIKDDKTELERQPWYCEEIVNGYGIIKEFFKTHEEAGYKEAFIARLSNIAIIRTQVPKKIDLNHYFEIMNTRGEQLELHEIVKARIISSIADSKDKNIAAAIWDACAQMDKYVQMSFEKSRREKIFGDGWDRFDYTDFDGLRKKFDGQEIQKENKFTLKEKLMSPVKKTINKADSSDEENERFDSIISFPNFLLQVNEAMGETNQEDDTGLDDKRFIRLLESHWENNDKALNFIFYMLKYRFLFDKFIIKREYARDYKDEGKWSLQRLEIYEDHKRNSKKPRYKETYSTGEDDGNTTASLRMLQSCLRITYTSPKTMHWIAKALCALNKNESEDLVDLLEKYCCEKVADANYETNTGLATDRIVFTYLDYILYRDNKAEFSNFQFQFRTSIEHFYPQHPISGNEWKDEILHNFGNLALITVSANSRFSNMPPEFKVKEHGDIITQSPKLIRMSKLLKDNRGQWNAVLVKQHRKEMIKLLKGDIERKEFHDKSLHGNA